MPIVLPERFAALIFDCDGTLVDTAPAHYNAIRLALAQQGHSIERDWYMERTGLTPDALLDAHSARLAAEGEAPLATAERLPAEGAQPLDRAKV